MGGATLPVSVGSPSVTSGPAVQATSMTGNAMNRRMDPPDGRLYPKGCGMSRSTARLGQLCPTRGIHRHSLVLPASSRHRLRTAPCRERADELPGRHPDPRAVLGRTGMRAAAAPRPDDGCRDVSSGHHAAKSGTGAPGAARMCSQAAGPVMHATATTPIGWGTTTNTR